MGNFEDNRNSGRSRDRQGSGNRGGGYSGGNRDRGGNRGGGFNRSSGPSEMHNVICDQCKAECQVPFKPSNNKPVLCSNCFSKAKGSDRGGSRNNSSVAQGGVSQEQFNQLNTKLDKIINILQELEIDEGEDEEDEEEEIEDDDEVTSEKDKEGREE